MGNKESSVVPQMDELQSGDLWLDGSASPGAMSMDADSLVDEVEEVNLYETVDGQISFIEHREWWEDHWQNMPEFSQKDLKPHRTIYIHFEMREHVEAFFKLIRQSYTPLTQYVWFPKVDRERYADKKYIDRKK